MNVGAAGGEDRTFKSMILNHLEVLVAGGNGVRKER
jgi:hypothetical protein